MALRPQETLPNRAWLFTAVWREYIVAQVSPKYAKEWPGEASVLAAGAAGNTSCDLVLGVNHPSAAASRDFVSGVAEFVLVKVERLPLVCDRFDQAAFEGGHLVHRPLIEWQECPVHPVANHG